MAKYKITLPTPFDGPRFGILFVKGEGLTDNSMWAANLKRRGYAIEEVADDYELKSVKGIPANSGVSPASQPDTGEYVGPMGHADPPGEPGEPGVDGKNADPLASMSASQLRKYASENGIDLSNTPNRKDDILVAINKAIEEWKDEE